MEYVVALLVMTSVALLVAGVASLSPSSARLFRRRLAEGYAAPTPVDEQEAEKRRRVEVILAEIGERVSRGESRDGEARADLVRAGYYGARSAAIYHGSRAILAFTLGFAAGTVVAVTGFSTSMIVLAGIGMAVVGFLVPRLYLRRRIASRRKELTNSLADALDLLVVCVEAGLGLNQALVRVSNEIDSVSEAMSEELELVNLEIQAGTPRDEALQNFAERTGVQDIRSFVAMLVQTDRYGTSIARSLRVHSDTLRTKRRQRAEEAAAKTTIKLVFPLVLFVFPAMIVVILGPAILHILGIMRDLG